jgi:hypothetical protein
LVTERPYCCHDQGRQRQQRRSGCLIYRRQHH